MNLGLETLAWQALGKSVQWLRENLEMQEKSIDDSLFSDAESRRDEWNRLQSFLDEVILNSPPYLVTTFNPLNRLLCHS